MYPVVNTGRQYQTVVEKCLVIIILHNRNLEKTFLAQTTDQTSFTMWVGFYVSIFHKNHRLKLKEFSSAVPIGSIHKPRLDGQVFFVSTTPEN